MNRFGDDWTFDSSAWDGSTSTPAPSGSSSEIPYYLARPEGMDYSDSGGSAGSAVPVSEGSSTSIKDWFGMGKDVVGTFVDIFGRPVQQPPVYTQPPPSSGMPVWGWALIGVGAVAALGLTLRAARPSRSSRRSYRGRR